MARQVRIVVATVVLLVTVLGGAAQQPAAAQSSPPFVETAPAVESVPQYLRQLAGRDLDDLLLAEGVVAQSGWIGGKYAFYLDYHGAERAPDWLALSLVNTTEQKPPLNVADIAATLLAITDRAAFLRDYGGRLAAPGPWRFCVARNDRQVLIHNRGAATFVSFAHRTLSADLSCTDVTSP